jgi:signal transduction histidine kinase
MGRLRPLDFAGSIKFKLGIVILAAVAVVVAVNALGAAAEVQLWAIGLVAGSLALLMVQILARGMTSPLREMAKAATSMARGDYSKRVTASSRDEVGQLARAFNSMAGELAEIDRQRRDLIANVSHELRTPISAMQAVLENLVDGVEPPDPETLRTVLQQVERLGRLVAQLLDLSRLESGAVPLERRAFAMRPVVEQAVREQEMHLGRNGSAPVRLEVSVPADLMVDGDPERVHQVMANLVQNAVRHSPSGGTVHVAAQGAADRVRIEVSDEGPGIPDADASRVFERFYRSDAARSSRDGGTGLGLAIARWVVDLHGGQIRAERNEPTGCRMVVELPRAAA